MKIQQGLVLEIVIVISFSVIADQAFFHLHGRNEENGLNATSTNLLSNVQHDISNITVNSSILGHEQNVNATEGELDILANEIIRRFYFELQNNEHDAAMVANTTVHEDATNKTGPTPTDVNKQRKLRVLTPVDLTKQFTFDDEEEMATANYSEADIENMKLQIENIFRSDQEESNETVNANSTKYADDSQNITVREDHTVTSTEAPSIFQSIKTQVNKGASFFGGIVKKPFEIIGNAIRPTSSTPITVPTVPSIPSSPANVAGEEKGENLISTRISSNYLPIPTSLQIPDTDNSRIIFPDDEEFVTTNQNKRNTNITNIVFASERPPASVQLLPRNCKPHEIVYNYKCELLFSKGPCEVGHVLLEDDGNGQVTCSRSPCPDFPQHVPYNGTCVMQSYFTGCSAGMHLILERSGKAFCDCKPGYIYSSQLDKCFEAYTRGPCQLMEYFVLGTNLQPQCVRNPCQKSGYVCYGPNCPRVENGNCVRLQSFCENGDGIFLVNTKTLTPECLLLSSLHNSLEERVLGNVGQFACAPGTKRDLTGKCRKSMRFTFS